MKCLSRVTGNCHARFLGGKGTERSLTYPVAQKIFMTKIKKSFVLISVVIFMIGCDAVASDPCEKYKGKSTDQINFLLSKMDTAELSHEIYLLGECKIENSLPLLERYSSDKRITHHVRHKGMTIGKIAKSAINKIHSQ